MKGPHYSIYVELVDHLVLTITVGLWLGMTIFVVRAMADYMCLMGVARGVPSCILPWLAVNMTGIILQG